MGPLNEFEMFTEIIFHLTFQCNYSVKYVRNDQNQSDIISDLDSLSTFTLQIHSSFILLTEIQLCKDQYI